MTAYLHTKFGLIWIKETKVTKGGGIRPPQIENVLNRPDEIGLNQSFTNISSLLKNHSTDLSHFDQFNLSVLLICRKKIGDD